MEKERTFRNWVNEHSDTLYRFALQRLRDDELCKDLVQETFLAAWRNMDGYKGEASVKNWLFVIIKSKITDHYRKAHTRMEVETIRQEHGDHRFFDEEDHWRKGVYPKQWSVDFSNPVEAKEFQQVFRSCGKKLKTLPNTVFAMKYVDGLSSEEICRDLSLTSSNYWVLLHRAKVQLRACLEKNWLQK
ncbi:sigma-70 family RNA polymerase sigma factor [Flavitalea antarctica]